MNYHFVDRQCPSVSLCASHAIFFVVDAYIATRLYIINPKGFVFHLYDDFLTVGIIICNNYS